MLLCRVDQLRMLVSLSVHVHRRTIMSYVRGLCTNASSKVKGAGILAGVDAMVRVSNFRNQDVQGSKFCVVFLTREIEHNSRGFPRLPAFDVIETTSPRNRAITHSPHTLSTTTNVPLIQTSSTRPFNSLHPNLDPLPH
jgi:hypothetical protein